MSREFAISLALVALFASSSLAQCNSSGCGQRSFFENQCSSKFLSDYGSACGADCGDDSCKTCGGCYLSVFGGYADIDNFQRKLENGPNTNIDGAKLHDDFAWGASIGRQVHPYGRGEFEFTVRDNEIGSWFEQQINSTGVLTSNNVFPATGSLTSYSGMFNFLFDLYDRRVGCPGLYLGAGLGAITIDADFATATNTYKSVDTSFAFQLIGGFNYALSDGVDLYTEYRYLGADYVSVDNLTTGQSLGDFSIDTNNIFFGARFRR